MDKEAKLVSVLIREREENLIAFFGFVTGLLGFLLGVCLTLILVGGF